MLNTLLLYNPLPPFMLFNRNDRFPEIEKKKNHQNQSRSVTFFGFLFLDAYTRFSWMGRQWRSGTHRTIPIMRPLFTFRFSFAIDMFLGGTCLLHRWYCWSWTIHLVIIAAQGLICLTFCVLKNTGTTVVTYHKKTTFV